MPFERYRNGHIVTVPAVVGGSTPTRMVLDTGIGLNLLSNELSKTLSLESMGATHVGRRMSGQPISTPLTTVPSISIGPLRQENVVAGLLDLTGFFPK
ncbi:MAG: retropepsin-like aspartic protease, partial [Thermoplasmata archaeon]